MATLRDSSMSHALSSNIHQPERYKTYYFVGVMIYTVCLVPVAEDTGSTRRIVETSVKLRTSTWRDKLTEIFSLNVVFHIPFPVQNEILLFSIHIFDVYVPLILSLFYIYILKLLYNNLYDHLYHVYSG